MEDQITLIDPLDMHVHFRQSPQVEYFAPLTARTFSGALIMPNIVPPVRDATSLERYKADVQFATRTENFVPFHALFFNTDLTEEDFDHLDILSVKLYPDGITTNSEGGVASFDDPEVLRVMSIMEERGIVLCVHGETNDFVMDREKNFLERYKFWAEKFPKLKIVMEHITTAGAVKLAQQHENLFATITAHHLFITLDDVVGGMISPHNFCKPIAKRPEDRDALVEAALEINGPNPHKFMLGTDSAPHNKSMKESACGCAGVFTAPIALQLMAQLFAQNLSEPQPSLQRFVSCNAKAIYKLDPEDLSDKVVTLTKSPFIVPKEYHGVVPFMAGKEIEWSVQRVA